MKKIVQCGTVLLLLCLLPMTAMAQQLLIPGGEIIGLHLDGSRVRIAALAEDQASALQDAGLQIGDELTAVDGKPITGVQDLQEALAESDGEVELTFRREDQERTVSLHPKITDEGPKLGLYLKEGISGIGTVSWYDPETGQYGALGHGVKSGEEQLSTGQLFPAAIASVKKGRCGEPGQLRGRLESKESCGTIEKNVAQGIFGTARPGWTGEPLPVASPEQVHTGKAMIRSTVSGTEAREYDVEIVKIYPESRKNGRNLLLKITDADLLDTTGGIVQGMSGSPIIQDGRIIGAVTHVLVSDPTTGYGIFIENMLDAAA